MSAPADPLLLTAARPPAAIRGRRMAKRKEPKPRTAWWAAGLCGAIIAIIASAAAAAPSATQRPHASVDSGLDAVAAISPTSAWAVGSFQVGAASGGLIEHWNGSSWKVQKSAGTSGLTLSGLAVVSNDDAWAVGGAGTHGVIEHWNGHAWALQTGARAPTGDDLSLQAVTATSASNAWATGVLYLAKAKRAEGWIEHWDGKAWSRQPFPSADNIEGLDGVAATSPKNAWAVGNRIAGFETPPVLHWHNGKWSIQRSQNPCSSCSTQDLTAVTASSSMAAFAAGELDGSQGSRTVIERLGGGYWQIMASANKPNGSFFDGVAATSADNAWAVGGSGPQPPLIAPLIEHFNGKGPWAIQSSPAVSGVLQAVAATSASNAWAVGYANKAGGSKDTLIEHWNGSSWTTQPSPNM
jgi:hypothetical protein